MKQLRRARVMCRRLNKSDLCTKAGSITVFMSLMLMLIASLLFTLLEGSRYTMLGMMAALNSQSVTESMFAEYNVPAYENYHLLMMDSGYGTGELQLGEVGARMQELGQENLNPTVVGLGRYVHFLQMNVTDSSVVQYRLATDQNASVLLKQMTQVMKKELAMDLAEQAYQKITGIQESGEQGKKADKYLDGALDTIEQAKEEAKQAEGQAAGGVKQMRDFRIKQLALDRCVQPDACMLPGGCMRPDACALPDKCVQPNRDICLYTESGYLMHIDVQGEIQREFSNEEADNPMEDIKSAKSSPLLSQILSDGSHISAKQIAAADAVEKRTLNVGNYEEADSAGLTDRLLVVQYLKKYTSNYLHELSVPHALAYEQEYILFGRYSDEDNLKKMASRLLLVREGINFAYLMTDSAKREEALAMATAIAAAAGIPAAAKAIQMGILASWAYAESIVELRTLFTGGKVAAVKTADSWTVSLAQAASIPFQTSVKAKEVSGGLSYEDYIQAFLMLDSLEETGKRFANLLEKNIRLYAGYEQVKLDCMITAMETEHVYQARQVFLSFVTIGHLSKKGYQYERRYQFSYTDKKDAETS